MAISATANPTENKSAAIIGTGQSVMTEAERNKVEETRERIKASAAWLHDNFWGEWQEAFRSYEVKTEKLIYPPGHPQAGKEDKTRTNIAMPEMFVGIRKKAVRKSRRPPNINVRSSDQQIGDFLSHMATVQWDRAGEQKFQRRHVLQGDLFGISIKLHYYDQVSQQRSLRFSTDKILKELYVKIDENDKTRNNWVMADEDDKRSVRASRLNEQDRANVMASLGPEVSQSKNFTRFDGPVSEWKFIGDWYPEPEFDAVQSSAWHVFEGIKDAEWLAYMASQKFTDPETGKRRPIIDPKFLGELETYRPLDTMNKSEVSGAERDFKQTLRDVIFKARPSFEARLIPGRRYLIHQDYTFRKGFCWIRFIGNEKVFLGEMPLPWDLGGRYPISTYCPMPSLLQGIGDSTARKGRHLWKLHNITVSQRTDLITNALKKLVALPKGADIPPEIMDLGLFRVLFSDNYREIIAAFQAAGPQVPAQAFEQEAAVMRMLQMVEPSIIDFGEQSQAVPNTGKTATLGILQQRSADGISGDELECLNDSIAEETDIKLSMWQQVLNERELESLGQSFQKSTFWTISTAGGPDKPRRMFDDPLELQVDFEVEPEMGSTLALDDAIKKNQAQEIYDRAIAAPTVWNVQEAALRLARASGVSEPDKLMAPPPPPPPPPPPQEPKISGTVNVKVEADVETSHVLMSKVFGIAPPSPQDTEVAQAHEKLAEAAESAKHARFLLGEDPDEVAAAQGNNGAGGPPAGP
jgi:hypothetical protein